MPYPTYTSGQVMDKAASLYNDTAKTVVPYTVQLPYLNMALQELAEFFALNNIPVTDTVTANPITIAAGVNRIRFAVDTPPAGEEFLPNDLIEPTTLWERSYGSYPYVPMGKMGSLPLYTEGIEISQFMGYVWESQEIKFLPTNQINQIKMSYIRNLFTEFTDTDGEDDITIINSKSFLEYRTAALLAEFIGENKTRSDDLNNYAGIAMDRTIGIGTKGRQAINTRHRPFRASFKRR